MIILHIDGPLGQEKSIEQFSIRQIHSITDVSDGAIAAILKIEAGDDAVDFLPAITRMMARVGEAPILSVRSNWFIPSSLDLDAQKLPTVFNMLGGRHGHS